MKTKTSLQKKGLTFMVVAVYVTIIFWRQPGNAYLQMENDALVDPKYPNEITIKEEGDYRVIDSNGIPNHPVGAFPGPGNPNTIYPQHYHLRLPLHPQMAASPTSINPIQIVGVAKNGVLFDPETAEFWHFIRGSIWRGEAIVLGRRQVGLDQNYGHPQPNGAYHYHGIPTLLVKAEREKQSQPAPIQVGWAADGYPVYDQYGYADPMQAQGQLVKLLPSYRVKSGSRPGGLWAPSGDFDGTYTPDYEFVEGLGNLDECNGRFGVTAEYPDGTYYYVLTDSFPYIPRLFKGVPDPSFGDHGHAGEHQLRQQQGGFGPGPEGPPPNNPGAPRGDLPDGDPNGKGQRPQSRPHPDGEGGPPPLTSPSGQEDPR